MTTETGQKPDKPAPKLRRSCENCPWRVDAPRGYWDPQHFIDVWKNCQDDGLNTMLCHKSRRGLVKESNALLKKDRGEVPCQGWIRVMGFDAIGVRLLVMRGQVTFKEVEDKNGPKLFPTFTAMMRANKIKLPRRSRMKP